MQVWNVSPEVVKASVAAASERYGGNVICDGEPEHTGVTVKSSVRLKLRVKDSAGPGAGISIDRFGSTKKGYRRKVSACWHAHRDVLAEIFRACPDARVKSVMADYRGADDFERKFPDTAHVNIGSMVYPVAAGDSCLCDGPY